MLYKTSVFNTGAVDNLL